MGRSPTLEEVQDAVRVATGHDGIPAEALKQGWPDLLSHVHTLVLKLWEEEKIPSLRKETRHTVETTMVSLFGPPLGKSCSRSG